MPHRQRSTSSTQGKAKWREASQPINTNPTNRLGLKQSSIYPSSKSFAVCCSLSPLPNRASANHQSATTLVKSKHFTSLLCSNQILTACISSTRVPYLSRTRPKGRNRTGLNPSSVAGSVPANSTYTQEFFSLSVCSIRPFNISSTGKLFFCFRS